MTVAFLSRVKLLGTENSDIAADAITRPMMASIGIGWPKKGFKTAHDTADSQLSRARILRIAPPF